ncbi:hypothetical protein B566_EDAN015246 [Ephemera danica]|nr:hypothetical protein B566_EDAN015246 [Ephemera danica]
MVWFVLKAEMLVLFLLPNEGHPLCYWSHVLIRGHTRQARHTHYSGPFVSPFLALTPNLAFFAKVTWLSRVSVTLSRWPSELKARVQAGRAEWRRDGQRGEGVAAVY